MRCFRHAAKDQALRDPFSRRLAVAVSTIPQCPTARVAASLSAGAETPHEMSVSSHTDIASTHSRLIRARNIASASMVARSAEADRRKRSDCDQGKGVLPFPEGPDLFTGPESQDGACWMAGGSAVDDRLTEVLDEMLWSAAKITARSVSRRLAVAVSTITAQCPTARVAASLSAGAERPQWNCCRTDPLSRGRLIRRIADGDRSDRRAKSPVCKSLPPRTKPY